MLGRASGWNSDLNREVDANEEPTLQYGGIATRWGVMCDSRENGVTITLPATLASSMRGAEHPLVAVAIAVIWVVKRIMRRPEPPRMILELNRDEFRIEERNRCSGGFKMSVRTWPHESVGELRKSLLARPACANSRQTEFRHAW